MRKINHSSLKALADRSGACCLHSAEARLPLSGTAVPSIEVHLLENVFNPERKHRMIRKLTDAMVSIGGENMRSVTWVEISEVVSGELGIGGRPLTTEVIKDLVAGR
jgi:4-oxalocrotonate tautomerase